MAQPPTPPSLVREFTSSSGRTVLQYYSCTAPGSFRGVLQAPAGFEQVEVLLTGFTLATDLHVARVERAAVNVQKFRYDPQTGELELGVRGQLATDGQTWRADVTFVVILTDSTAAHFTRLSTGCGATAECNISQQLAGAIPSGMQYIGLATQIWDLGSRAGAVPLNGIAAHMNAISVNPPNFGIDFAGALRNGAWTNDMFFEWQALTIAFDPTEMTRAPTWLPNQYTFIGKHASRLYLVDGAPAPAGPIITGFLDAFEGLVLLFSWAIGGPEYPVWMIEASAVAPVLSPSGATTEYGILLGTTFGDTANTAPYEFQVSRAAGFLH
jgi:hypothetical protein